MTPAVIDSIFQVKLRPPKDPSASPEVPVFSVIAHVDWYYSIILMMYPNNPQFFFQWGQDVHAPRVPFPGPEGGICVNSSTVLPALQRQGWSLRSVDEPFTRGEPSRPVRTYSFAADNESLRVRFGPNSNCLISIDIMRLP